MKHNKNFGFTLIELLAIIAIIGIISVIIVPVSLNLIESSRIKAFKNSVYNGAQAIKENLAQKGFLTFPVIGVNAKDEINNLDKNPFIGGKYIKKGNHIIAVRVKDDRYCASGPMEKLKVVKGDCSLDDTTSPDVNIILQEVTTNSITAVITATDYESEITGYNCFISEQENSGFTKTSQSSNVCKFENLKKGTTYYIKGSAINQKELEQETEVLDAKTVNFDAPIITSVLSGGVNPIVTVTIKNPNDNPSLKFFYQIGTETEHEINGSSVTFNIEENTTIISWITDGVNNMESSLAIDVTRPSVPTSVIRINDSTGEVRTNSADWTNNTLWWGEFTSNGNNPIDHYEYSTNCTGEKSGNLDENYTYSSNQNVKYCIRAVDTSGVISDWSSPYYFNIDKSAPTCTSSGGSTSWTNGSRTLTGTCSDTGGSGCKSAKITKAYSTNTNTTTASPGTVYDNAGNSKACPGNQTVRVDTTAPSCTSSGGSTSWTNGSRTLKGTCSDTGGSGCKAASVTKGYTTQGNWSKQSPGTVYDNAGNSKACPANQTVKIDKTAPKLLKRVHKCGNAARIKINGVTQNFVDVWFICLTDDGGSGLDGTHSGSYTYGGTKYNYKSGPDSNAKPACGTVGYIHGSGAYGYTTSYNFKVRDAAGNWSKTISGSVSHNGSC